MRARAVVRRGVRLGAIIGAWPAAIAGVLCLLVAFVFLVGDLYATARVLTAVAGLAVLGSMAVGLTLGAATGLALAVAPGGCSPARRFAGCWRHSPPGCRSRCSTSFS